MTGRRPLRGAVLATLLVATAAVTLAPTTPASAMSIPVTVRVVIGHSAQGREIVAYHRYYAGLVGARPLLVVGQMHGDEETGKSVVAALRTRVLPLGLDLWLVPTVNPDGDAANTRYNAHRVDLNRNFPTSWVKQGAGTRYYSGPKAASEPETQDVMTFLLSLKPWRTISFHAPLNGVDTSTRKDPALAKNLAAWSGYPTKSFTCTTGCHGTMTQFINARTPGAGVTFEFGSSTSTAQLNKVIAAVVRVGTS
jgi:murein peptide amidase A